MIKRFVATWQFQYTVIGIVLIAAVLVGLETYPGIVERYGGVLHTLDTIVIALFALEAILKLASHGRHFYRYFHCGWNVFDFVILIACLIPADNAFAPALRLIRVMRVMRMFSALPRLQLLVNSLLKSLPSMGYIGLLLLIIFYVYAVTGVFLWRDNDPGHFRDLPTAMLSLFRVVTLEDWTDIMYTQMYGSDVYPSKDDSFLAPDPKAAPLLGAFYFVSFVLLGTMIILNLFIGVILNSMQEAQRDAELRKLSQESESTPEKLLEKDAAQLQETLAEATHLLDRMKHNLRQNQGRGSESG